MKECKRYLPRILTYFAALCLALTLVFAFEAALAGEAQYGRVNYNQVRLRKVMESTDVWTMLNTGDLVQILNTHSYNGTKYYYVTCNNPSHPERQYWGYIDQTYVTLVSSASAALQQATATPQPNLYYAAATTAAPAEQTQSAAAAVSSGSATGNIQFTAKGVNLRKRPNSEAKVLGRFEKDEITPYYGIEVADGHTWYRVSKDGSNGYVMGDYVRVVSGNTAAAATAAPAAVSAVTATAEPAAATAAAGSTAAQGNIALTNITKVIVRASGNAKGTQIKLLNRAGQVCTLLGPTNVADGYTWYNVQVKDVTGWIRGDLLKILSASESAAYTATGAAASAATANSTTLYTPELSDWNTGDIQQVFYKGCIATVTDVKTGISFQVKRWSGGSHADVEPLTAADTAAICKIYGVSKASDITENKNYQRRSILVTIGTRSFAASMYGVPHNASEGNTIKDNNYTGQFCIHFTNSATHGSQKVDADHQNAVNYAYTNAVTELSNLGYTFQ